MVSIKWYTQNCHFVETVPKYNGKTLLVPELQYNVVDVRYFYGPMPPLFKKRYVVQV